MLEQLVTLQEQSLHNLKEVFISKKIILASASPRRREIFKSLDIDFEICPSPYVEVMDDNVFSYQKIENLAYNKALEVAKTVKDDVLVVGADTVVVSDGRILGKPADEKAAFDMLKSLSGKTHQVYTGVCVIDLVEGSEPVISTFAERTDVTMYPIKKQEILAYIDTKEPMDKAGAYAIQGLSAKFIKKIKGDYYNVVGLPMARLYQEFYK